MNSSQTSRAVVLLSGGLDSATAAAVAISDGRQLEALTLDYGQRQCAELESARAVGAALGIETLRVIRVDLRAIGGSALTDDLEVPKDRTEGEIGAGIPVTYVPARNTIFLALALAAAERADADAVVLGVNALDYSGYPDCRPAFLAAFEQVAATGTRRGVEGRPIEILAPLLHCTKAEIVRRGVELGVPYELTLSCYDPVEREDAWLHCGRCDACRLRAKGFAEAGIADPAPWA